MKREFNKHRSEEKDLWFYEKQIKQLQAKYNGLRNSITELEQSVADYEKHITVLQDTSRQQEKCLVQLIDIIASTNNKVALLLENDTRCQSVESSMANRIQLF